MDPVCIAGREGRTTTGGRNSSRENEWNGYQWHIPLDELFDCDSAPKCCRTCYYKHRDMSKQKKAVIVFFILAITIASSALIVKLSLGPAAVVLGIGDQLAISNDQSNFSPLLCSRFALTNVPMVQNPVPWSSQTFAEADALLLSDPPRFDAAILMADPYRSYQTVTTEREENMTFPDDDYFNYWAAYMDSGSDVDIALCPPDGLSIGLQILQGKAKLDNLLSNRKAGYAYDHTFLPCAGEDANGHRFAMTSQADVVAFVFSVVSFHPPSADQGTPWPMSFPVSFTFRRKELEYDDHAVYASCTDLSSCSLPVPRKARAVMLEMRSNASTWPITIRTECVPDIGIYFAFFVGVPAGAMLTFTLCGGVLYLCQQSVNRDIERAEERRRGNRRDTNEQPTSPPTSSSTSSATMSRLTATRRAFRTTTTSSRAALVDHDVLAAMAEVNRRHDLPPSYGELDHVSSPVDAGSPPAFTTTNSLHEEDEEGEEDPPSYESIVK